MDLLHEKYEILQNYLKELGSVAVAFSSGVDSTFLLRVALDTLGSENVIAVTASSCSFPKRELNEAKDFCKKNQIRHIVCQSEELDIEGFRKNPKNRCYLCKHELFEKILAIAGEYHIRAVVEGSNMDDNGDYRPGLVAVSELGIKSPLRHAKLYKEEIRELSKELGLPTWNKPSFACLASRVPYGEEITPQKLSMVERGEALLLKLGFTQFRVRIHGTMARIELLPEEFDRFMQNTVRTQVYERFLDYGFSYVSLDIRGYRMGSLNETLREPR